MGERSARQGMGTTRAAMQTEPAAMERWGRAYHAERSDNMGALRPGEHEVDHFQCLVEHVVSSRTPL